MAVPPCLCTGTLRCREVTHVIQDEARACPTGLRPRSPLAPLPLCLRPHSASSWQARGDTRVSLNLPLRALGVELVKEARAMQSPGPFHCGFHAAGPKMHSDAPSSCPQAWPPEDRVFVSGDPRPHTRARLASQWCCEHIWGAGGGPVWGSCLMKQRIPHQKALGTPRASSPHISNTLQLRKALN